MTLNSSTVSGNTAGSTGGGIDGGAVTLQNSILAGNMADSGPDCGYTIGSSGYNLIGDTSGCTFSPGTGDLTNVNANLGPLVGSPGYHPLLSGSPAIDAGNPTGCTGSTGSLTTDQRGAARVGRCDIGAYEYTIPGPSASISSIGGTPQRTPPFSAFWLPLQAAVLDSIGSPVNNVTVIFSAPASGASGTFTDTGTFTATAVTNESGIATAATFTANGLEGSYTVTATVSGIVTPANFLLSNIGWYVALGGDDANDCRTPATPRATINGALENDDFLTGDTVLVATGTYTGTGDEVVLLDESARLLGGWNTAFTVQNGTSTIDGQGTRRGITVNEGVTAIVERFVVQNGSNGISNSGTLTLNNSTVNGNTGEGITNDGTLTLNNTTVNGNFGGGIWNGSNDTLTLNNSTVGGNTGDGINNFGTLALNNSAVSDNTGRGITSGGSAILNNSTVSGNSGDGGIFNGGILSLNSSTVSGNTAGMGEGSIHNNGTLTLTNSTISGNSGNGIYNGREGTLTLNNSTISGNSGDGIYNYYDSMLTLNNSTISNNMASGINNSSGTVTLHNSTVSGNMYVGISNNSGTVTLQNSLLAGNTGVLQDCDWILDSAGYNLIGNTSGCDFTPGPGDLLDVDARLFPLIGSPGYHPLLPGSPAIDAGNPAGCVDHLGNPLDTDQRGVARAGRCDIGSYEFDPANDSLTYVFLPVLARNYCPDFFDGFGNPASGWDVVDDDFVRAEYLDGEYRVLSKQANYFYLFQAPTCDRQNYLVEVDARWVGTPGGGYGLIFGLTDDFDQYYLFDINTDFQQFRLLRRDPSGFTEIVPISDASAINGGTASNHLKVTRDRDQITLEVNGTVLGTWTDGTITGLTGVGLVSSPYSDHPTSDAHFDNFSVINLPGSRPAVHELSGATVGADKSHLTAVPVDMEGWPYSDFTQDMR